MSLRAHPPLPIAKTSYGRPGYRDFAFGLSDPEGMPGPRGPQHAAVDWFSVGLEEVRACRSGEAVEVRASRGDSGQVFGGTVKVRDSDGLVWVYRHVEPATIVAASIDAGEVVARVTPWRSGPSHLHLEIWRSLAGGYRVENAIDPASVEWDPTYRDGAPPPPDGGTLRLVVNGRRWAGWEQAGGAIAWIARRGLSPSARAAIAWRGGVWRGPRDVASVCRSLERRFL